MQTLSFNVQVSYFNNGELKKKRKLVTTTSSTMAWKAGMAMIPLHLMQRSNSVNIKVNPV